MGKLSGAARSIFNAKHPRGADGRFVKAGSGVGSSGRALPGIKGAAAALKSLSPAVTRGRAGTTQRNDFAAAALKDDLATASGDDRARLERMIGALDRQQPKASAPAAPATTGWQPQALPTDALDDRTDAQLKKLAGQFSVPVGSRGEMLFRLRQAAAASPEIRKRISEPAPKRARDRLATPATEGVSSLGTRHTQTAAQARRVAAKDLKDAAANAMANPKGTMPADDVLNAMTVGQLREFYKSRLGFELPPAAAGSKSNVIAALKSDSGLSKMLGRESDAWRALTNASNSAPELSERFPGDKWGTNAKFMADVAAAQKRFPELGKYIESPAELKRVIAEKEAEQVGVKLTQAAGDSERAAILKAVPDSRLKMVAATIGTAMRPEWKGDELRKHIARQLSAYGFTATDTTGRGAAGAAPKKRARDALRGSGPKA